MRCVPRVHVLIEDVHVAQSMPAEACPRADLDWMGILVHTIGWVQRLSLRPANEDLSTEALAPEDLLVGELHTHPILRPMSVPFCE